MASALASESSTVGSTALLIGRLLTRAVSARSRLRCTCSNADVRLRDPLAKRQAGTVPEEPVGTTMKANTRALAFASADPNVEWIAPVCSKNVPPAGTTCSGP